MRNLLDLVRSHARRTPDAQALVCAETVVTYRELVNSAHAFGHALTALAIPPDARVAIFLDKRVEAVVAMLGTTAAGGVFVPVNPLLKPAQVNHVLRDCDATCLVTTRLRAHTLAEAGSLPVADVFIVDEPDVPLANREESSRIHRWPWTTAVAANDVAYTTLYEACVDTDLAALLYTSGSTGLPKGVMLSHRNLLEGAWSVAEYLGHGPADRILAALPLSFDAGLSQLTSAWAAGATPVLLNYLTAHDAVAACEREHITALTGVPPLWMQLAGAAWPDTARHHLRYFANTGGRLPLPVLQKLRALFPGAKPFLMYGLTEAFRSTFLDPAEVDRRPDSIGKTVPNARVLVVRPDGTPCEPGEPGELVHTGAFVTLGYWNDTERTAQRYRPSPEVKPGGAQRDTAVWSGDLVQRDAEGFLYFIARNDAQIKSSGYRISPEEIEETVHASGLVHEVAAFGIPDGELGETVALMVVMAGNAATVDGVRDWCIKQLPRYMVPRHIVRCAEIPRNANGKFDRAALRTAFAAHALGSGQTS